MYNNPNNAINLKTMSKTGTYLWFPARSKEENIFWFFSMKKASSSPTSGGSEKLDSHFSSEKRNPY